MALDPLPPALLAQAQAMYLESWHDTKGDHAEPFSRQASAADASGNLYVASSKLNGHGKNDLLLTKYGSGGAVLWSEAFNVEDTSGNAFVGDLKLGPAGEVFVTGTVYNGPANNYDALTLKYSSGGTLLWHRLYNGSASHYDAGAKLYIDGSGNAYVAGGTASAGESMNMLCIRYDSGGTLAWARSIDGYGLYDAAAHIYQRSSNTVMVVGAMQQSLSSWAIGGIGLDMALGATSIPLAAFSEAGISEAAAIASDASGNLYVAAYSDGGASGRDIAVAKLDGELGLAWLASYDGPAQGDDEPRAIAVDGAGNVYVAGYATTAAGGRDFLVLKYDSTGAQQWATLYGGAAGQADEARALALGAGGELAAAGYSVEHGGRDYFTALLQPWDGQIYWSAGFNGLANGQDEASRVLIDSTGSIAVSGKTQAAGGGYGYTTVRYAKKSVLPIPSNGPPAAGLAYIENRGQLAGPGGAGAPEVKFYCPAGPPAAYLHDGKLSFLLARIDGDTSTLDTLCRIDAGFLHSKNDAKAFGLGKREAYHNYYLGHTPEGRARVGLYDGALLADIYDKISLQAGSNSAGPQYSFAIEPGGDPGLIRLRFEGHSALEVPSTGTLEIASLAGRFELPPPEAFLIDAQGQEESLAWQPRYALQGDSVVYFEDIGSYDSGKHLVIRIGKPPLEGPAASVDNLEWCTYYGGMMLDFVNSSETDANGNYYVVGHTISPNFPVMGTTLSFGGDYDGFLVKFDDDLNQVYATFIGGTSEDIAHGLALWQNKIYVIGETVGYGADVPNPNNFPLVNNGIAYFDDLNGCGGVGFSGCRDAFVAIFGEEGILLHATFFGNDGQAALGVERGKSICVDKFGNVIIAGNGSNIPLVNNDQSQFHEFSEGNSFIARFSSNLSDLSWSSRYKAGDIVYMKTDGDGNLFLGGNTRLIDGMPIVPHPQNNNSYQSSFNGGELSAFTAKLSAPPHSLLWSTHYGGTGNEQLREIAIDISGNLIIVGQTTSSNLETKRPSLSNSFYQDELIGFVDGFAAKFDNVGTMLWSTYLGGINAASQIQSVSTDISGNIILGGMSNSDDLLVTAPGGYFEQMLTNNSSDGYLFVLDKDAVPLWATFFGYEGVEEMNSVRVKGDKLYMSGTCNISPSITPQSQNAFPLQQYLPNPNSYFLPSVFKQNETLPSGFMARFSYDLALTNVHESVRPKIEGFLINIFPNPTNDVLSADLRALQSEMVLFTITDAQGRIIEKFEAVSGQVIQKDISNLPSGLYLLRISNRTGYVNKKFVVVK